MLTRMRLILLEASHEEETDPLKARINELEQFPPNLEQSPPNNIEVSKYQEEIDLLKTQIKELQETDEGEVAMKCQNQLRQNIGLKKEIEDLTSQLEKCNREMLKLGGGNKLQVVTAVQTTIKRHIKKHVYRTLKFHDGTANALKCITGQVFYKGIKNDPQLQHAMQKLDEAKFHCTHLSTIKQVMNDCLQCTQTCCTRAMEHE